MSAPLDIAERLRELGPGFNLPQVQALYEPLLAMQPRDGVRLHADVHYGDHERHALDVYVPEAPQPDAPVFVFFHGGGFIRGDKQHRANVGWHFARRGFVTVVPNYRLAPQSMWPSGPQDVVAVVDWLRGNASAYGGDPQRIVLAGESAGAAHVAAASLVRRFGLWQATGVCGVALISGPYDARLEGLAREQFGISTPDPRNEAYFGTDPQRWADANIVELVDAEPFPLLISFAERDLLQMQVQAGELFARLVTRHGFAPQLLCLRDHNHYSQTMAINTGDESLSDPLARFAHHHTTHQGSANVTHA